MTAGAVAAALWTWQGRDNGTVVSKEEAMQSVLEHYPGEITSAMLDGEAYRIELRTEQGLYALAVDSESGSIASVERLSAVGDVPETPQPTSGEASPEPSLTPSATPVPSAGGGSGNEGTANPSSPAPSPAATQKPSLLSAEEAGKLASSHVQGTVDNVERGEGGDYLVEIETNDGREAVVQVNAISGAVMSVSWDDDDDGNSSEDDSDDDD
nr:PepSY domain-containing protein [Paenibacillus soyae]